MNRKGEKKFKFKALSPNVSQLLDFVCIYGSHLHHVDATSIVDDL